MPSLLSIVIFVRDWQIVGQPINRECRQNVRKIVAKNCPENVPKNCPKNVPKNCLEGLETKKQSSDYFFCWTHIFLPLWLIEMLLLLFGDPAPMLARDNPRVLCAAFLQWGP